jgi:PAS domain S-box-containing protein
LKFKIVNDAFVDFLGYDKSEIYNLLFNKVFIEFDLKKFEKEIIPLINKNEKFNLLKTKISNKHNEIRIVNVVFEYIKYSFEEAIFIYAVDVTEKTQLEEKYDEVDKTCKILFDNAPLGIFFYDSNGIINDCNDVFAKIIGAAKEKIIGLDMNILPDKKLVNELMKALKGDIGIYKDLYTSYLGKKTTPVKVTFFPIKKDDKIVGGVGMVEDITTEYNQQKETLEYIKKLQESENRNKAILNALPDMMFVFDVEGNILDFHANTYDELYVNPEVFLNKNVYEVLPNDVAELTLNKIKDYLRTKKNQEYKYSLVINEEEKIFDSRLVPLGEDKYLAIVRNITETEKAQQIILKQIEKLKELNEQLTDANSKLEKAKQKAELGEKLKTEFIQNISHEIRTPINALSGFTELYLDKNLHEEKRQKYAEIILSSSKRIVDIVDNILLLSQINLGNVKFNISKFKIIDLIKELNTEYYHKFSDKNISYYFDVEDEIGNMIIEVDYEKLHKALDEILSNALKFTEKGEILFKVYKVNDKIEFEIKDTGYGIDHSIIEIMKKPFNKKDVIPSQIKEGLGIGLAISNALIDMLGGKISIHSEKNIGTNVKVTLPIKFNPNENKTKIRNILIADDDILNYYYLNESLMKIGNYDINYVSNGLEAFNFIKNNPETDLIFMDLSMPILNGLEATKEIRKIKDDIKIIALTAYTRDLLNEEYLDAFDDLLAKPFKLDKLKSLLNKIENE